MTEQELQEVEARHGYIFAVRDLLAEVRRLQAENAALHRQLEELTVEAFKIVTKTPR